MKYIIVLGDGMADEPIDMLGGKTPLEYASTPTLDALAPQSEIALVHTIPDGMKPGSDMEYWLVYDRLGVQSAQILFRTLPAGGAEHRCRHEAD